MYRHKVIFIFNGYSGKLIKNIVTCNATNVHLCKSKITVMFSRVDAIICLPGRDTIFF